MAVRFDGASAALDLGKDLNVMNNVPAGTIMAWIRPLQAPSAVVEADFFGVSIGPPPGTSQNPRLMLRFTSGRDIQMRCRALDTDIDIVFNATSPLTLGTWNHVAGVFDAVNRFGFFYVNGVLTNSSFLTNTAGNTSATNSKNASIGASLDTITRFFNGDIEDARIYERIVGAGEIMTIYTTRGKDGIWSGCRLRYPLQELGPTQPVIAAAGIGSLMRAGSPVGAPTYIQGVNVTRRRVVSPG